MKALRISTFVAAALAFYNPAFAQCDVTKLNVEKAMPPQSELRQSENAQVARDLRTLREAAVILDAKKHTTECRRLIAVVRGMVANPDHAVETSGDTDEDKAEVIYETRRRKTAANSSQ